MRLFVLLGYLFLNSNPISFAASSYKEYKVNWAPFKSNQKLFDEYTNIFGDGTDQKIVSKADLERGFEILNIVSKANPNWIDGYWMLGSTAHQWATSFNEEKDLPLARSIFVKGEQIDEACLKLEPKHALCKLFLAAAIGNISSIDGIMASLKNAKKIESLMNEALNSGVNYNFFAQISLQGSVRYGLGMYYRLVPDLWIIQWLFNVRGNIDKSIAMHRGAIAIDGANVCSNLMLAVSILCRFKGERDKKEAQEGLDILKIVAHSNNDNITMQYCVTDSNKILNDPSLACGYTPVKQQNLSENEVNKQKK